jgi:NADPH-dependent 2,4-dienoyl-CoA reductase/sulfur reductase-like enzyme
VPAVGLLEGTGIPLDDGVLVDERYETTAPGVFAAGDVARFFDPLFGRRRRIEHWSNADYQGTQVGRVLAGARGGYDTVSSFFTKVFGIGLQIFGDVSRFDHVTTTGSLAGRDLIATYDDGGRVVGALPVEPSDEVAARLRGLIAARVPPSAVLG